MRRIARRLSRLLPGRALAWVAAYRFGEAGRARRFRFEERDAPSGAAVTIDGRLTLHASAEFLEDLRYQFVRNSGSRNEMGAFLSALERLPDEALLVDVGAHRGLFSLVHCASGPRRRALLLEPSPSLAADARALLERNGFETRATVLLQGAGERPEQRTIVEDALHFARTAAAGVAGASQVPFTTLDHLWRGGTAPAIVKIDVEGAEAEVLRGAMVMLREARPTLFLELHLDELERRGEPLGRLVDALAGCGYQFFSTTGQRLPPRALAASLRAILRVEARPVGP